MNEKTKVIAYALEKKLALFDGEQLFIKVARKAVVGDVVVFSEDAYGVGEYLTTGKAYRVRDWHGIPAVVDDKYAPILVYLKDGPCERLQKHVSVYQAGTIEQIKRPHSQVCVRGK